MTFPASAPTVPPGPRRQCASILIINDRISEATQSFTVRISFNREEVLANPDTTEVFILDDDGAKNKWVFYYNLSRVPNN